MLDRYLEYYYHMLSQANALNMESLQEEELEQLILPVLNCVFYEYSFLDAKNLLKAQSGIQQEFYRLFQNEKIAPGAYLSYGTIHCREKMWTGLASEIGENTQHKRCSDVKKMREDSVFDLFSVTKIFTYLSILSLAEKKKISIHDSIGEYLSVSKEVKKISIFDLLMGNVMIDFPKSFPFLIDPCKILTYLPYCFCSEESDDKGNYLLLKLLIEKVMNCSFSHYLQEQFPMLKNDLECSPFRIVSSNYGASYYEDGMLKIDTEYPLGKTNDILASSFTSKNVITGSCGIFASHESIQKLCDLLFLEEYVKPISFVPNHSDSSCYTSSFSVSFSDARGSAFHLDSFFHSYSLLTANPTHHRVRYLADCYLNEVHDGKINLPNGEEWMVSTHFLEEVSPLLEQVKKLVLQYAILEDLYQDIMPKENVKIKNN